MANIHLLSSQPSLRDYLRDLLVKEQYHVEAFSSATKLLSKNNLSHPSILLIDSSPNDLDIKTLSSEFKQLYPKSYLILILDSLPDSGFAAFYRSGIDNFILKPLNSHELLARISLHLSRRYGEKTLYKIADLQINLKNFIVKRASRNIKLTPLEFKLLVFLARNKGSVLTRDIILSRVWGYDSPVSRRAVDVYIGYLRQKIDQDHPTKLIHSRRGFGYYLKD